MLIGKRVVIAPGTTQVLVDENDFDGSYTVVLVPHSGPVLIGDSAVDYTTGFQLSTSMTLHGVADDLYGASPNAGGGGAANTEVYVLAYSVQEG